MSEGNRGQTEIVAVGRDDEPPLLSVSCLTYNQRDSIAAALEGILAQQVPFGIEILVHDDASSDGTAEIVRHYAAKNPSLFRPLYQAVNQYGLGVNPGILNRSRARGKYLAICDGDDYWIDPHKLRKQVEHLEAHPECGLVFTRIQRFHQASGRMEPDFLSRDEKPPESFEDFLANTWLIPPSTWVVRSQFLERYNAQGLPKPGWLPGDFSMLLWLRKNHQVHFLPDTTTVYRVLPQSVSHLRKPVEALRFRESVIEIVRHYSRDDAALSDRMVAFHLEKQFYWFCRCADRARIEEAYRQIGLHGQLKFHHRVFFLLSFSKHGMELVTWKRALVRTLRLRALWFFGGMSKFAGSTKLRA